jgi:AraC family transcriptional regulator of arabinose operon
MAARTEQVHSFLGRGVNDRNRPHRVRRPGGTDVHILEYSVSGQGVVYAGDRSWPVPAGDVVIFKSRVPQDYGMDPEVGAWDHIWLCFQPRVHWFDWLRWPEPAPGILQLSLTAELRERFLRRLLELREIERGPLPRRWDFVMNGLEELLLWCDTVNPSSQHSRLDPRIRLALEYLCAHSGDRLTITELAEQSHLSASRLAHLFREQVGMTPMQYLERHRMERARGLLLMTNRPIGEIAYEVGYQNPLYFSRVFSRHQRKSPREFRRRRVP